MTYAGQLPFPLVSRDRFLPLSLAAFHAADVSTAARPTYSAHCRPPSPAYELRIRDEDATPPIRQSLSSRPIPLSPVGAVSLALTRKT
ncbi:hypothetical protein IG631_00698 [Alternaria alternata]|nr:hypothetical protein IG631_00698 [Alternaria alternata]